MKRDLQKGEAPNTFDGSPSMQLLEKKHNQLSYFLPTNTIIQGSLFQLMLI